MICAYFIESSNLLQALCNPSVNDDHKKRVERALEELQGQEQFQNMDNNEKIQYIERLLEQAYSQNKAQEVTLTDPEAEAETEFGPLPNQKRGLPLTDADKLEIRECIHTLNLQCIYMYFKC